MDTLPSEIISLILDLLPFTVRRNVAMMNKMLYYASLHPILLHQEYLVYNEESDDPLIEKECSHKYDVFENALMKTERTLIQLKLQKLTFDHVKYLNIFKNCGDRISLLCLDELSSFTNSCLDIIGSYCKNLQKLKLLNIHQFLIEEPCQPIPTLHSITFKQVTNMSDKEFNLIIQCAPNLKHLKFKECQILTWPRIISRYYRNRPDTMLRKFDSNNVFTDVNVLNYLKTAKSIKSLNLQNCYHIFYKLPKDTKLNSLSVQLYLNIKDEHIDNEVFKLKLGEHTSLRKLEITNIPCCYLPVISKLYNLNYLSLSFTTHVKSICIDKAVCVQKFYDLLKNMKNIKTLIITKSPSFDAEILRPSIPDYTLNSLKRLDSTIESAHRIINLGQNLIDLRIQNGEILQSSDFVILFKTLINLKCLTVENCVELTDAILLSSPISNIKGLYYLHLINARLTHRSLRQIKLFHLENLFISSISLGSCIETRCMLDFEESMKQLSYSSPVLTSLLLSLSIDEVILLRNDENFYNSLSKTDAYINCFKNLKKFQFIK